jgi:hypothetical protein
MKTVYIFGAGASRASTSRTPTIKEIFIRAKEVGGKSEELRKEISDHLEERFGIRAEDLLDGSIDFERVFTLVVSDRDMAESFGSVKDRSNIATAEIGLESLVYELLMTVTWNEIVGTGDLYDQLVEKLSEEDVLISFNYDLQLDSALERSRLWSPLDGYGIDFFRFQNSEGKQLNSRSEIGSKWRLLKLHGSLNWFRLTGMYGHATAGGWKGEFSEQHKGRDILVEIRSRSQVNRLGILDVDCIDGPNYYHLNVNIIPPSLRKELSPQFMGLWRQAKDSIIAAERIVVIGYSLPPTDFAAEWLFRTAARLNQESNVRVEIANPDEQVWKRFADLFGDKFRALDFFRGFDEFIAKG